MSYSYETQKERLFTDQGQRMFLEVRDRAHRLLKTAGAFRLLEAIAGTSGDSWLMIACVDRMLELGEIRELTGSDVWGQYRCFTTLAKNGR